MTGELELYRKVHALQDRLELASEEGHFFTVKAIAKAIMLINEIDSTLDRRLKP